MVEERCKRRGLDNDCFFFCVSESDGQRVISEMNGIQSCSSILSPRLLILPCSKLPLFLCFSA